MMQLLANALVVVISQFKCIKLIACTLSLYNVNYISIKLGKSTKFNSFWHFTLLLEVVIIYSKFAILTILF